MTRLSVPVIVLVVFATASFRKYLQERLFSVVSPPMREVNLLDPSEDAIDAYAEKLAAGDIDLACIGIGENGHVAFNVRSCSGSGDV